MISSFDVENLQKLLRDFYTAVGIRISVFDHEFRLVTEYPEQAPRYCTLIRRTEAGLSGCRQCDREACERARRMRTPHTYVCHAGLTEAITPIQVGGGVIGYAILAHMLPTEQHEAAMASAVPLACAYGVRAEDAEEAIRAIADRTEQEIAAAVSLLDAVASYVYIRNLAVWHNEDIAARLEAYIRENVKEPITVEGLADTFHISRSKLYQISMRAFGMGIKKYLAYCRLQTAKRLLLEGCTIAECAEACGYGEYNYFCKVFKNGTGLSPTEFIRAKA